MWSKDQEAVAALGKVIALFFGGGGQRRYLDDWLVKQLMQNIMLTWDSWNFYGT